MSRRERAKDSRRNKILRTARDLIQATGKAGFSMRALANGAGLSEATPYNLFGSKKAIMIALLDDDVRQFEARLMRRRGDELARFFGAITLTREWYAREPNYHRVVLAGAYQDDGRRDFRADFRASRSAFWQRLVAEAIQAGVLNEGTPVEPFARTLAYVFRSAILEWVQGDISLQEMGARANYGFALILSTVATPAATRRLDDLLHTYATQTTRLARRAARDPDSSAK